MPEDPREFASAVALLGIAFLLGWELARYYAIAVAAAR